MKDTNLESLRGDTLAFGVEIEGLTTDLATAYFSCKSDPTDTTYIFQKSLTDGITKVSTGTYRVRVAPEDTKNLDAGTYYYDLQIGVSSDIYTIMIGKLKLVQDVTNGGA